MFSAEDGVTVEAVVEAGAPEETIVDRGLTLVLIPQGNEIFAPPWVPPSWTGEMKARILKQILCCRSRSRTKY